MAAVAGFQLSLGRGELMGRVRGVAGGRRTRARQGRCLRGEPLSNLDAKLRVQMRAEIAGLQRDLGVTTIYVTHDQVEAMTMGDRVAVMRKGELQQVADPQTLYDKPVNLFVGGFIGSPALNLIEATLDRRNGGFAVKVGAESISLDDETLAAHPALPDYESRDVVLGIRPEDLEDVALVVETHGERRLKGKVQLTEALGSEIMVHFTIEAKPAVTGDVLELAEDVGDDRVAQAVDEDSRQAATLVG